MRHDTAGHAAAALHSLQQRRGWQGHMSVYHCRFCGGYHHGHTPSR